MEYKDRWASHLEVSVLTKAVCQVFSRFYRYNEALELNSVEEPPSFQVTRINEVWWL